MLDPKTRKFSFNHPIHVDQYGGVVCIIDVNSPFTLRGTAMPILAYRTQVTIPLGDGKTTTGEVTEEHYTLGGRWDHEGKVSGYDLWDADLASIKPVQGWLTTEQMRPMSTDEPLTTDDDYEELTEQLRYEIEHEADLEAYEGDPDEPMGSSSYTGRNI